MIDTRVVKDESGMIDLCETFTDDESKVLKQIETGIIYGNSVIDVIAGFYWDKPYSRFTYEEIDAPPEHTEENDEVTNYQIAT